MIEDAKKQCEKTMAEMQLNIEKLSTMTSNTKKCGNIMEVDAILTSLPSTFSNLPVEIFLERKRTVSDVSLTDPGMSFSSSGTKRKDADSRAHSQHMQLQHRVESAQQHLANRPRKMTKSWHDKEKKAEQTLATAKKTHCYYFHVLRECKKGKSCLFLHRSSCSMAGTLGHVKLWLVDRLLH